MPLTGKKVALIGYGISHKSLARYLVSRHIPFFVSSTQKEYAAGDLKFFADSGAGYEVGGHTLDLLRDCDPIIVSPGVPLNQPVFQTLRAEGRELIGDIELFYRLFPDRTYLCITGSNGKTTTTELSYFLLRDLLPTELCGNVGRPIFDFADSPKQYLVVEISSFQIDTLKNFSPRAVVLTNLQPNHIDRYGGEEPYYLSKMELIKKIIPGGALITNFDCPLSATFLPASIPPKVSRFAVSRHREILLAAEKDKRIDGYGVIQGATILVSAGREHPLHLYQRAGFQLQGLHNLYNLAQSLLLCQTVVRKPAYFQERYCSFAPLPHRLEMVRTVGGVAYINDSKATGVHSAVSGIQSLEGPLILLAGGKYKGESLEPWRAALTGSVRGVILFGEARVTFSSFVPAGLESVQCADLEEALRIAQGMARAGDKVVLSPACASYDQFKNYEERGRKFKELVERL